MPRKPERGEIPTPAAQARSDEMQRRLGEDRRADFGRLLRLLREVQGLDQADLAARSGLHRSYIGGVERGERNITLDNIWALADGLDLNAAEFFIDGAVE